MRHRVGRGLIVLAGIGLLAGCASRPALDPRDEGLSGRIAVRVDEEPPRSVAGSFELRGDAREGALTLISPLGTQLAAANWSPDHVMLRTGQGMSRYPDLDSLAEGALGERLPLAALFDWLRGRPWPNAPSERGDAGFTQLGWSVDLAGYGEGRVVARRAGPPAVHVQARLDRAESAP
jgi:outer membrane lipoprotein LolB